MVKFKDLSKLSKKEIDDKIKELDLELVKARIAASKGGKVKIRETKKTLAKLNMIKARIINETKK
ncbi:MAG: 50S ribosomal protein L29 [Candidatus Pacearchaeota archaeon]|jgi:ribosomal protein L29